MGADQIAGVECDVFAPCATGGILDAETVGSLRCRIVARRGEQPARVPGRSGAARRDAGILYAPDFVINAGGVIHLVVLEAFGGGRSEVDRRLEGIGDTLREVYRLADSAGLSTGDAAEQLAAERIAAAAAGSAR